MTDRLRLLFAFDPARLQEDLARLSPSGWIEHFVKDNYEGDWSALPLRGPTGATHPVMSIYSDPTCTDFSDTPMLEGCPYFREVLAAFDCELDAVRLMRLGAGATIKEHRDHDLSMEDGVVRLHIPVTTSPNVDFFLNDRVVRMRAGECWYLRLCDPHRVINRGRADRIHMVIDARVDDWLRDVLSAAERAAGPGPAELHCGMRPG